MKSSRKRLLKKIFANVTVGLLIVIFFGNSIAGQFSGQINSFLGTSTTQIVGDDAGGYMRYYESEYSSIAELKAAGLAKAEEVEAEGAVLLKNNGILPLKSPEVSLFGRHRQLPGLRGHRLRRGEHRRRPLLRGRAD